MKKKLTIEQRDVILKKYHSLHTPFEAYVMFEDFLNENTEEELDKPCPKNCKHYKIGGCKLGWIVYCDKPELIPQYPCPECGEEMEKWTKWITQDESRPYRKCPNCGREDR